MPTCPLVCPLACPSASSEWKSARAADMNPGVDKDLKQKLLVAATHSLSSTILQNFDGKHRSAAAKRHACPSGFEARGAMTRSLAMAKAAWSQCKMLRYC